MPGPRRERDVVQARVLQAADDPVAAVERDRVADERPHDRRDGERGDAHHERVERVLRAHEARVEEAERGRHQQDERGRREHPGGVARVHLRGGEHAHDVRTGVTAPSSVSPVRMRTTRSSGTTKILPSPTSPVCAPAQSASIVGCDELVGDGDLEADLLREPHLHGRAAVGLDAVELASVALNAGEREAAHLGCGTALPGRRWPSPAARCRSRASQSPLLR